MGSEADHFITIGSTTDRFLTPSQNIIYHPFHQINTKQRFSRFAWLTGEDQDPCYVAHVEDTSGFDRNVLCVGRTPLKYKPANGTNLVVHLSSPSDLKLIVLKQEFKLISPIQSTKKFRCFFCLHAFYRTYRSSSITPCGKLF